MTLMNVSLLAAGDGSGKSSDNFLIPNGTFIVELVIFVTVLAVIWKFVVPPIQAVLEERERRIAQTNDDNQKAAQAHQAASEKYSEELSGARSEANSVRDNARAEGQKELSAARVTAQEEVDAANAKTSAELRAQAEQISTELKNSVTPLSEKLVEKVLSRSGSGLNGLSTTTAESRTE